MSYSTQFDKERIAASAPEPEAGVLVARRHHLQMGPRKFGIFDTFANKLGRNAHLTDEIAKALRARANELLAVPTNILQKMRPLQPHPLRAKSRGRVTWKGSVAENDK